MSKENYKGRHHNWGGLLLGLGTLIAVVGPANTYLRTGALRSIQVLTEFGFYSPAMKHIGICHGCDGVCVSLCRTMPCWLCQLLHKGGCAPGTLQV